MPYSKEHKAATRKKILDSAITLFSSKGYDQVSIDMLMQHADLTRGAFYAHFKNKKEVYAKAIFAGARKSSARARKPEELSQKEWGRKLLSTYLSKEHVNQQTFACPLAFLVTDIANKEPEIKQTYTLVYKQLNRALKKLSDDSCARISGSDEQDMLAITALMIGGVAIGRALDDPETTEKLLDSCRKRAIELLERSS